ncbi:unnamed protein product, partial [Porites evermanni]
FQNKPGEHLEETDAASEQKSLTDCLFTALTSVVTPVFIRRNSAEFLIQKIPDAHLLLNSRVDQRQNIADALSRLTKTAPGEQSQDNDEYIRAVTTHGEVQRQNRELLESIRVAHSDGKNWREGLNKFLLAY